MCSVNNASVWVNIGVMKSFSVIQNRSFNNQMGLTRIPFENLRKKRDITLNAMSICCAMFVKLNRFVTSRNLQSQSYLRVGAVFVIRGS